MTTVDQRITALEAALDAVKADSDTFYLLWAGTTVFLMQLGFAALSAGSVRAKNVKNIMLKCILDACVGAVTWYFVGFGFAYNVNPSRNNVFIGGGPFNFALSGVDDYTAATDDGYKWIEWFFQYAFAAAAATIVSGAVAERCTLSAYLVYTFFITGFIYPVVVHWVWDANGWLYAGGVNAVYGGLVDFAGSGVVHMSGGIAALVGAKILGPRSGRFETDDDTPYSGHSSPLVVIGTFLLWFGWYGFNPGSTLRLHENMHTSSRAAVTTTLSAASAAIAGLAIKRFFPAKLGGTPGIFDLSHTCNSLLGGLVGVTAATASIDPWAAIVIGIIAAFCYHGASCAMRQLKIDDPLDAFAVHGACGMWGVVAVGFFATDAYSTSVYHGVFYGGGGNLLGTQIIGILAIGTWVTVCSFILFGILHLCGIFRVSEEVEELGSDVSKHGGQAYAMDLENTSTSSADKVGAV